MLIGRRVMVDGGLWLGWRKDDEKMLEKDVRSENFAVSSLTAILYAI